MKREHGVICSHNASRIKLKNCGGWASLKCEGGVGSLIPSKSKKYVGETRVGRCCECKVEIDVKVNCLFFRVTMERID